MTDNDLIRRKDALNAVQLGDTVMKMQARIAALPAVTDLDKAHRTIAARDRRIALARRGAAVQFALDRIGDWERDYLTDDMPDGAVRDWLGHVSPALERLKPAGER